MGMADRIHQVWRRLAAIERTAESADGHVTVTVGARGEMRSLVLDPRLYRTADANALARTILDTVAQAVLLAGREAFDVAAPLLARDATFDGTDLAFDLILRNLGRTAAQEGAGTWTWTLRAPQT